MNLAWFNFEILGNYLDEYLSIIEDFRNRNSDVYDRLFRDEMFGYRKGEIENQATLLYIEYYFYLIFQKINNLEDDTRENRIAILEDMQWECIVKTLFCKGIKIGKYYNTILNLS